MSLNPKVEQEGYKGKGEREKERKSAGRGNFTFEICFY